MCICYRCFLFLLYWTLLLWNSRSPIYARQRCNFWQFKIFLAHTMSLCGKEMKVGGKTAWMIAFLTLQFVQPYRKGIAKFLLNMGGFYQCFSTSDSPFSLFVCHYFCLSEFLWSPTHARSGWSQQCMDSPGAAGDCRVAYLPTEPGGK